MPYGMLKFHNYTAEGVHDEMCHNDECIEDTWCSDIQTDHELQGTYFHTCVLIV